MTVLLIDSDGGIDDIVGLWWAATQRDVDIVGVTAVWGNVDVDQATSNLRRVLHLASRAHVPVGRGAAVPFGPAPALNPAAFIHGEDGMGDAGRPPAPGPPPTATAVDVLRDEVHRRPGEVVVVTLGPLSNLAEVIAADPTWAGTAARLVVMGGAVLAQGNAMPVGEANIAHDPVAAQVVFGAGWASPPLMVGLDVTLQATLTPDEIALAREGRTPAAADLAEMLATYQVFGGAFCEVDGEFPSHDALAVIAAVHPEIVSGTVLPMAISTGTGPAQGMTVVDRRWPFFQRRGGVQTVPPGFSPCHVAMEVDAARFRREIRRLFGD
jgi:purine nucleosidase